MNQTNFDIIELDSNYSTTRRVIKADPQEIAGLVKQANKPEDKFETVLFLPEGENRQGEGGLRTLDYFKAGGIIPSSLTPNPLPLTESTSPEAKPLITVVTVVYNGEKFLEETILSVINQTYDNVEYIIIDGGSTDGTLDIIKKYEHAIDYWVSEKDKGIYDAMNKGIDLATGEWINFMNGGDAFYSFTILDKIVNEMKKCHVVYGNTVFSDKNRLYKVKSKKIKVINHRLPFCHQSSFVKAKVLKKKKFSIKFLISSDYEFFIKIYAEGYVFKNVDLYISQFESGGVSNSSKAIEENFKILRENGRITFSGFLGVAGCYFRSPLLKSSLYKKIKNIFLYES